MLPDEVREAENLDALGDTLVDRLARANAEQQLEGEPDEQQGGTSIGPGVAKGGIATTTAASGG